MNSIKLYHIPELTSGTIHLPGSKSESNRVLVLNALSGWQSTLSGLSIARDTQTMDRLITSSEEELDVIDAGTVMRFLTAYLSVKDQKKILTGTPRMQERPIKILVEALKELGAEIDYLKKEGFPPLLIQGFGTQLKPHIKMRGNVSSQYLSAILMIGPTLPLGLRLEIEGELLSRPYLEMTASLMRKFGVEVHWNGNIIEVTPQKYLPVSYQVEPDWSGASYWYSLVSLASKAEITLQGLREDSLQGDSVLAKFMVKLGVESIFDDQGVRLSKKDHVDQLSLDFRDCPDLAQTVIVLCAAKGIRLEVTGIENLAIKETDRIQALKTELAKIGGKMIESGQGKWLVESSPFSKGTVAPIITYGDHRMAMAFAPLATKLDLTIEDPEVVEKSYPGFWNDLEKSGVRMETITSGS